MNTCKRNNGTQAAFGVVICHRSTPVTYVTHAPPAHSRLRASAFAIGDHRALANRSDRREADLSELRLSSSCITSLYPPPLAPPDPPHAPPRSESLRPKDTGARYSRYDPAPSLWSLPSLCLSPAPPFQLLRRIRPTRASSLRVAPPKDIVLPITLWSLPSLSVSPAPHSAGSAPLALRVDPPKHVIHDAIPPTLHYGLPLPAHSFCHSQ
ncbi:hypothetical protein B0H14DRAFT_3553375 [Mycena olivaceomarginata]|nr:hypothetical protein B0H14DRAFT_3553375 [Mycena olivaceomarginata]